MAQSNAAVVLFKEWEYEEDPRIGNFDENATPANDYFNPDAIEIPYEPREQFLPFHNRPRRFAALVCHRRAGKTVACVAELVHRALYTTKENARYAYIAPFYRQAKDVAWVYLKQMTKGFAQEVRESELRIVLPNGAWITLYGADNPDALRGLYLDGAILDEFGDCRPTLWAEVVLPTLMDRSGWVVFIGTPKGKNEFYRIIEQSRNDSKIWYHLTLKASESGLLSEKDLELMRSLQTEDQYQQEMECSFEAAVLGTYYASQINTLEQNGHVSNTVAQHDPNFPVYAVCDLGFTDSTAFWFWQQRPDGLAIIDYEEDSSKPLHHYLEMLDSKPYNYETIYLPHDARAKTLQTGRSTVEQVIEHFKDQDVRIDIVPNLKLQHGIDAARLILPSCYFDLEGTSLGIECLRAYRRKYDEVEKCFSKTPLHDWSSHGADAFRYLALVVRAFQNPNLGGPQPVDGEGNFARPNYTPLKPAEMKLDELFKAREERMRSRQRIQRLQ